MQTSNANRSSPSDDPVWYFLVEFSLGEFLSIHNRRDAGTTGLLFQAVRELGMPHEWVENIEMTLAEFANEELVHFKQGRLVLPERIRIFCQKKIINEANSMDVTSRPYHTERAMEHTHMLLDSAKKMNGGWGCFLIERGGADSFTGLSVDSRNPVDLYFYKEGE